MTVNRAKVVVWDSIGNTVLGVRPWQSWDPAVRETLLRENPAAREIALPLRTRRSSASIRNASKDPNMTDKVKPIMANTAGPGVTDLAGVSAAVIMRASGAMICSCSCASLYRRRKVS